MPDVAAPDLQISNQEKDGANRVEYRIEGRQIVYGHPYLAGRFGLRILTAR